MSGRIFGSTLNVFSKKSFVKPPLSWEISTQKLLQDLGFIHQPSAGMIHWLPIGLKVLNKVIGIIKKHMEKIGAEEFLLSSISSKLLWEKTGRWDNKELFKLSINSKDDYCLTPTHEEEITELLRTASINYKSLPILTYQISRKYRMEKRPRGGLLRGREFLMKDAYSFDINHEAALKTYHDINETYLKIFKDLKVPFEIAQANSGNIGGNLSHEWHFIHKNGEDTLFKCDSCYHVSNIEKTISLPLKESLISKEANVKYFLTHDKETLIAAYYPSNRKLEPNFIKEELDHDIDLFSTKTNDEIINEFKGKDETELILKNIIRIMDFRINNKTNLPNFPLKVFQKNNFSMITNVNIVQAIKGEICNVCKKGFLKSMNSIEVGHTFYLGKKYSTLLNSKFIDIDNKMKVFEMGCYGIGISRIVAAIAELSRDEEGIRWPSTITPYDFSLICMNKDVDIVEFKKSIDQDLSIHYDYSKIGFGSKLIHSKMMGIPLSVIIGKKYPILEIEVRGKRWYDEESFKQIFNQKNQEWKWEWEWDYNLQKGGIEKHYVHKDYVSQVIRALLKDM